MDVGFTLYYLKNVGGFCALVKNVCRPFAIRLWRMCHGENVSNVMCNISHVSGAYWKTLVQHSGRISNERFTAGQQTTTETLCFSWREMLQHWCSNGSKCQKIIALIGFSIPSVKICNMPDIETYKTMAKLRIIEQLSSRLGHRNLLLQLVSRIISCWISWLEFLDFVDEHSSHSGDTTKSKWQMVI